MGPLEAVLLVEALQEGVLQEVALPEGGCRKWPVALLAEVLLVVALLKAGDLRLPVGPLEAAHPRVAPLAAEPREEALQEVVRLEVVLLEEVRQEGVLQEEALQEEVHLEEVCLK